MRNIKIFFYAISFIAAIALLFFAIVTFDSQSPTWSWAALVIYSAPLVSLIFPWPTVRYYVFLFVIFIFIQTIIPAVVRSDYYFAQPNFKKSLNYAVGSIPGVSAGIHNLTTDEMGYRSTSKIDYSKKFSGVRIFTIGGSTTQMLDMDDQKTWSALLGFKLNAELGEGSVEVINAGLAGTRAEQSVGTLRYIRRFHPDIAIILVGTNDWRRHIIDTVLAEKNIAQVKQPWEKFSLKNSLIGSIVYSWKVKSNVSSEREISNFSPRKISREEKLLACRQGEDLHLPDSFPQSVAKSFATALDNVEKECNRQNLRCVVMTQPHGYKEEAKGDYREGLSCNNRWGYPAVPLPPGLTYVFRDVERMGAIAEYYNDYVRARFKESSVKLCDLSKEIPGTEKYFYDEVHYTELGSNAVADLVHECIKEEVLALKTRKN